MTSLVQRLKNIRRHFRWRGQIATLRKAFDARNARAVTRPPATPPQRLLIIPGDVWTLIGSKGDEAMMQAASGVLRARCPSLHVGVIVATPEAAEAATLLGFEPVQAWSSDIHQALDRIEAFGADGLVMLGADIMDGYYNPATTAQLLLLTDAAARRAVRTSILGFSFNAHPNPLVRPVFEALAPSVAVNVRDRVSMQRFNDFCNTPATLVADMAFMLQPDTDSAAVRAIAEWATRRRAAGDAVLGFNLHPVLVRGGTAQDVQALIDSAITALRRVAAGRAVSVLLISHDYRGAEGDDTCLAPVHAALSAELGDRLLYPTARHTAAELKAMAGLTDCVVTGRMHLAIASLGMGRPVAGLTYQDKFQGLLGLFDYPAAHLLAPADAKSADKLARVIDTLLDQTPELAARVARHLPDVRRASERNLDRLVA